MASSTESKDYKETVSNVASCNSKFNFVDKDGRVHDRWNHNCNRTRETWIGEDGLSLWRRVVDEKTGEETEKQVFSCEVSDQKGITVLTFLAQNHEEQDNYYLNMERMKDWPFENKRYKSEMSDSYQPHPLDQIPDSRPSVEEQVFSERQEGPSKSEKLRDEFRQAVKETTTKHPEKYDLYLRHYDQGVALDELIQERYEKTGKKVSNQAESDVFTNIVRKAYKHLTGEKDLPKRRNR